MMIAATVSADEIREVVRTGLPRAQRPQRVAIIGAGMAGLTAAWELKKAGHEVTILEAQTRVGGRVLTLREPFSEGLYGEAGAMRIPDAHDLTRAYCEKFALPLVPFVTTNDHAFVRVGGRQARRRDFLADPTSFGLDAGDIESNVETAWAAAFVPVLARMASEGADAIEAEFDRYSLRDFLCQCAGWSEAQVEILGLLSHMESLMDGGFVEVLREEWGHWFANVRTIAGGMDRLPRAFLAKVGETIHYGRRVEGITRAEDGAVRLDVRTPDGSRILYPSFDRAIVTLPFSVLRNVDLGDGISREKQRAIREVTYDASVKVFLQARERFWEERDGIFGGATVTDLPIRALYYPLHGRETGRGVLLASYTWAQDAVRWGAMTPDSRIAEAVENVTRIHGVSPDVFEGGASKVWAQDPYAGGAFAMFSPGQHTRLQSAILHPEGRLHFAGEHASEAHAWIQGAIESGLRAAIEVHEAGEQT